MKRKVLRMLLMCLPAWAQTTSLPPAEYQVLDVAYQLGAGPTITERRSGALVLSDSPMLAEFRKLVIPRRNRAGAVQVERLELEHAGAAVRISQPVEKSGGYFVWNIENAQPGDVIRFAVQQPVDLTASGNRGWWFVNATAVPLPVQQGVVTLVRGAGFTGSFAPIDEPVLSGDAWLLSGSPATDHAARFVISSFANWQAMASWFGANCSTSGGPRARALAGQVRTAGADAGGVLAAAIQAVRRSVADTSPRTGSEISLDCRPVETVLASETGNEVEIQAVLASVLEGAGFHTERMLTGPVRLVNRPPNPGAFTGALLRYKTGTADYWIDARHLEQGAGGLPLRHAADAGLRVAAASTWTSPLAQEPGVSLQPANLSVDLEGSLSTNGGLYTSAAVSASGSAGDGLISASTVGDAFSAFLRDLPLRSASTLADGIGAWRTEYISGNDNYLPLIDRRKQTTLSAVRLSHEMTNLPGGAAVLGSPGTYKEVVRLEVPSTHLAGPTAHVELYKDFATYSSDAKIQDGLLLITRQLDIKVPVVSGQSVVDAQAMWSQIQTDQERKFTLTRMAAVDWNSIVAAMPPDQLVSTGWKVLYTNQEFDAARRFFERASELKQPQAWFFLGQALERLNRIADAQQAYEKQILEDPKMAASYTDLANTYLRGEEFEKAIAVYTRRLAEDPKDVVTQMSLTNAYLMAGRPTDAESIAKNIPLVKPFDRSIMLHLTAAKACRGEAGLTELDAIWGTKSTPEAETILEYIMACGVDSDLNPALLAKALEALQPFIDLRTNDLRSVFAAQHAYARVLYTRARIRLLKGEREAGIADLRASAGMSQDPMVVDRLAHALWDSGQQDEALDLWADALEIQAIPRGRIPEAARGKLPGTPKIVDRDWYELALAKTSLADPEPRFYYVRVKEDGSVDRVRALTPELSTQGIVTEIGKLEFPLVRVDGKPAPSGQLLMLKQTAPGTSMFYRSTSLNAFLKMTSLASDMFPVAAAVTASQTAAAQAAAAARQ